MTFWQLFLRLFPARPHKSLAALYWHLTRRKVRAHHRLRAATADLPLAYDLWVSEVERTPALRAAAPRLTAEWQQRPRFAIVLDAPEGSTAEQRQRSIRSLERQIYTSWTLHDAEWLGEPDGDQEADFLVPLRAGNVLSEAALFRFAEALQGNPAATVLYGDQDELTGRGRRVRPWFKPRWNPEMFLALDYLSEAVAIRAAFARTLANEGVAAAVLGATASGSVVHVPHVVCHVDPAAEQAGGTRRLELLSRHLGAMEASCAPGPFGTARVRWALPQVAPKVSVIVPTKDQVELLRACIEGLVGRTDYPCLEILIVDNGSVAEETKSYLKAIEAHPAVRVLRYDAPYNYSAINNFAAEAATGSYLCLLNNDTEVVEPAWLTEMMRYAVRPEIGAVGAKLLYPDGTIQHAGVVVGMGDAAGHAHRFTPASEPGYFRQPHVAQFVTAVTAACLVVAKEKFQAVGGLDEEGLAIAYNDIDLCLKLQAAGWKNVYVPHAVLLHHESKSRGSDFSPAQRDRYMRELETFQERWGTKTYDDPLHHPALDRYNETFVVNLKS